MKSHIFTILALIVGISPLFAALTPAEHYTLAKGEMLVFTKESKESAWPDCTIYKVINCSPKELAAALTDYPNLSNISPSIISAIRLKNDIIKYEVRFPIINKITYTVKSKITKLSNGVVLSWYLVSSPFASKAEGSFEITEYQGKTLLKYTNSVTPTVIGAGAIKHQAVKEAKTLVTNIKEYAELNL